jgi:hypothetical protein
MVVMVGYTARNGGKRPVHATSGDCARGDDMYASVAVPEPEVYRL